MNTDAVITIMGFQGSIPVDLTLQYVAVFLVTLSSYQDYVCVTKFHNLNRQCSALPSESDNLVNLFVVFQLLIVSFNRCGSECLCIVSVDFI